VRKLREQIRYITMIKAEMTKEKVGLLYARIEQNPALSIWS